MYSIYKDSNHVFWLPTSRLIIREAELGIRMTGVYKNLQVNSEQQQLHKLYRHLA